MEKNYQTHFFNNPIVCFQAEKAYWKNIELSRVMDNTYYGRDFMTIFDENEDREAFLKNYSNYRVNAYSKENYSDSDVDYTKELTEEAVNGILMRTKKRKTRVCLKKQVICCPECHKVQRVEQYLQIKESSKKLIENIEKRYGPDWYSLFELTRYITASDYFEPLYGDFCGSTFSKYLNEHPDEIYRYPSNTLYHYYWNNSKTFYPKLICSECGCNIAKYIPKYLSITDKLSSANTRLEGVTIFNDEEKIAVSTLHHSYYINVDAEKISREDYRMRVTFNLKTGQTYFIGPKKLNGKKMPGFDVSYLSNITYRHNDYNSCINTILNNIFIKKEVLKHLIERNGHTIKKFKDFPKNPYYIGDPNPEDMEDICFEEVNFTWLTLYNRFPSLDGKQIMQLYDGSYDSYCNHFMKDLFKGVKRDASAPEILNMVIKNCNMPNSKKTKKYFLEDFIYGREFFVFSKMGFRDINFFYKFIELYQERKHSFYVNAYRKNMKYLYEFTKDLIKYKGEPNAFNTLFKNKSYIGYIKDSAMMYVKLKKENMVINDYFKDDIKKIHDRMSLDYTKIKNKNEKISYSPKAESLNYVLENGIEFTLAEDTNELVRIGQELKICVGSYREVALDSSSIILTMKQDGKYVGCIELDRTCKRLIQAKAACNNLLQGEKAKSLKKWVKAHDIETKNCVDYTHISANRIEDNDVQKKTHDYHYYELDENGEVRTRN